jgi:hypothetical protein
MKKIILFSFFLSFVFSQVLGQKIKASYSSDILNETFTGNVIAYLSKEMQSFNAVFSKKGKDGKPEQICNTTTGEINPKVSNDWKKYDISFYLRNHWEELKSELDGKIRISIGTSDNFLLNHSVTLLESEMKKLNSNFQFAYYPGDHLTVNTTDYKKDGFQFLAEKYREWLAKYSVEKK